MANRNIRLGWILVLASASIHLLNVTAEAKRIGKPTIVVEGGNCPGPPRFAVHTWMHVPATSNLVAYVSSTGNNAPSLSINPPAMEQEIHVLLGNHEVVGVFRGLVPGVQYSLTSSNSYPCSGGSANLFLVEGIDCPGAGLQQVSQSIASCSFLQFFVSNFDLGEVAFGDSAETSVVIENTGGTPLNETLTLGCGDYSIVGSPVISLSPGGSTQITVRYKPTINDSPLGVLELSCDRAFLIGSGIGPRLLWHDADEIGRARLDGTLVESTPSSTPHMDFAIDYANGKLYRAESNATSGAIYVSGLLGGGTAIVTTGRPWSIALDTKAGKVYWADPGPAASIRRANLDGSSIENLPISVSPSSPPDIAVDPDGRLIYWTVVGGMNVIRRANLDGSSPKVIATFPGGGDPQIALDRTRGRVYWSQGSSIGRANIDGTSVGMLLTPGLVAAGALAIDAPAGKLYWADTGTSSIHRVDLQGANPEDVVTGATGLQGLALILPPVPPDRVYWNAQSTGRIQSKRKDGTDSTTLYPTAPLFANLSDLALDPSAGKLYWLERGVSRLRRGDVNGNANTIQDLVLALSEPEGLALDVMGGKVYWTESGGTDRIRRANLDGSGMELLIGSGLFGVRGIVVDAAGGKMYWTETEPGGDGIYRANLNGTVVETLVPGLQSPVGIALDIAAGKIYWTDDGVVDDKVQRANLDGSVVETLVPAAGTTVRYLQLDLGARQMYWSDVSTATIWRANLDGSGVESFGAGIGSPIGIAVTVRADYPQTSGTDDPPPAWPVVQLEVPRPNPFNPSTTIAFVHPGGALDVSIYDARGRLVRNLVASHAVAGRRTLVWEGTDNRGIPMTSGVYFVKLRSQNLERSVKAVLVR